MKIAGVRYIGFAGIALFAVSCFMNTRMSRDYSGEYRPRRWAGHGEHATHGYRDARHRSEGCRERLGPV
jgi:hypothetical protein